MKVLVTGATGYVGGRLVPRLLERDHDVHVLVRDADRIAGRAWSDQVTVHEGDVLDATSLQGLPRFDAAYYLIHAMAAGGDFESAEAQGARSFVEQVDADHIVYLGGLQPEGPAHAHLRSRERVGQILAAKPSTEFRAGPIIGSGSASFEMVRYLSERLPLMVTPKWVHHRVQPIAIRDVLGYLVGAIDVGPSGVVPIGGEPLSFAQMMQQYADVRGLRRRFLVPTPVLAPKLAARWVQLVTPIPNSIAVPIIEGITDDLVADTRRARDHFPDIEPMPYRDAVALALDRIDADATETHWSGAGAPAYELRDQENLLREQRSIHIDAPPDQVFGVVSSLGGDTGWLTWQWAWRLRGALDKLVGGPGLRRGRRRRSGVVPGEAVDFWRVEAVEPDRLLRLRAEMKLPGKAWLEYRVEPDDDGGCRLTQTALFEPKGLPGIAYWTTLYPIHRWLFRDLVRAIAKQSTQGDAPQAEAEAR